jgi:hypothetical protein
MINPLKELQKEHEKNRQKLSEQTAITETHRLLSEKGEEDYQMLRDLGMHKNLQKVIDLKGKKIEIDKLEEKYGRIYTRDEIKAIACRYALKFRRTDQYKGYVDPAIMQKIRELAAETGDDINASALGQKFYILAPASEFELQELVIEPPPRDPILFYQIRYGGDEFRAVHQWGNDMSWWREFMGWKYNSEGNYFIYWLTLLFTIFFTFSAIVYPTWWMAIHSAIFAFCISMGRITNEKKPFKSWEETWENEYKPKP